MKESLLVITRLPKIQQALAEALGSNFSIKLTENGIEALEWLENENVVDAFLIDLNMSDLRCSEFIQTLRLSTIFRKTPILLFSSETSGIKYLEYGIEDYISDPYNQSEVQIRVKNTLRRYGKAKPQELQKVCYQTNIYHV